MRRERLADFLEHNGASCCQAFMLMLHSEQEWGISAGEAPRPSSCCRGRQILTGAAKPWPAAQAERGGEGSASNYHRVLIMAPLHKLATNPRLFNLRLAPDEQKPANDGELCFYQDFDLRIKPFNLINQNDLRD